MEGFKKGKSTRKRAPLAEKVKRAKKTANVAPWDSSNGLKKKRVVLTKKSRATKRGF